MTTPLSQGQKALNQRLLADHCIPEAQLKQIYDDLIDQQMDMGAAKTLADCIKISNGQLAHLGLEIVALKWPGDQQRYYAIRNQHDDPVAHSVWSTQFGSPAELEFATKALEKLTREGPVEEEELVQLRVDIEHCKASMAEAVLEKLRGEMWIQKVNDTFELAPRTYLELSHTMVDQWGMDSDKIPQTFIFHKS
jgi:Nse1 non-SMC component of SMC5-6 complex